MVLGDNMILLASSAMSDAYTVTDSVYGKDEPIINIINTDDTLMNDYTVTEAVYSEPTKGVTIIKYDTKNYGVNIEDNAPDVNNLIFLLEPTNGTVSELLSKLKVKKDESDIEFEIVEFDEDGYIIKLYQEENGQYVSTGLGYMFKRSELEQDENGFYKLDMAVTVGDIDNHLEADKNYKIGITAFKLIDNSDDLQLESYEVMSGAKFLRKATYPVITYDPTPSGDGMKVLNVTSGIRIIISSDVEVDFTVSRVDTNEVIYTSSMREMSISPSTPSDFEGIIQLKVTATDEEGDTTVDYILLNKNDNPPLIRFDNQAYIADYKDGSFTITGVTEGGVELKANKDQNDYDMDDKISIDKIELEANGQFRIEGRLDKSSYKENLSIPITVRAKRSSGIEALNQAQIVWGQRTENNVPVEPPGGSSSGDVTYRNSDETGNSYRITTDKQANMPTVSKISLAGTVEKGVLNAKITEDMIREAIKAAQDAARKSGNDEDGIAIEIIVNGSDFNSLEATSVDLDAKALGLLKEAGVKYIKISSAIFDISFNSEAILEIDKQSTNTVTIAAKKQRKLSNEARKLIGNRPVLDITVGYKKNDTNNHITNFGDGMVTIGIPYSPKAGESTHKLYAIYVAKNGRPEILSNSRYENGRLIFQRTSLSSYGVGYKEDAIIYTDLINHWAKDYIEFVTSNGLMEGRTESAFGPNEYISRADFLKALVKLYGADISGYKTSRFIDVKDNDPYLPYIEWAADMQIVKGIGNNMFGPDRNIKRQDMAVMMQNLAKATGYDLAKLIPELEFSDHDKIDDYAKDAVRTIQEAAIMQGKGNNIFDPQGNTTRAEAAVILKRFSELVIDKGVVKGVESK